MNEAFGAVDRIQDPFEAIGSWLFRKFFTENGVVGERFRQFFANQQFSTPVGCGDWRRIELRFHRQTSILVVPKNKFLGRLSHVQSKL